MTIVGERLKTLRTKNRYSQTQIADMCGVTQATIGRYETGVAEPPIEKLLWYAETFEVSLDYIFGRTDDPNGHLYEKDEPSLPADASINDFIEFCFDPTSPANAKLKKMLVQLMQESTKQPDKF
ncbi:MAG: helix-turn-helix transcriptional regulator [Clostridia bacterium]|nr:helix-turn-helix transcriptional regulator [Clostridia bacterium]